MIYYNCKKDKSNPKSIKYMLGTTDMGFGIKTRDIEL